MQINAEVKNLLPGTERASVSYQRVTLRRYTRADLDARAAWPHYDEPVFGHLNLKLDTAAARDRWFDREWVMREPFWFAVDDEHDRLIGSITLREVHRWRRIARLGVHLHPQRLGQGYGTEAMWLFCDYYFNRLDYRLLKLDVATYNVRAVRVYEKLGFEHVFEFWRPNMTGIRWLEDPRFAGVRHAVERHRGSERIRHYEMHLSAERWRERQDRKER